MSDAPGGGGGLGRNIYQQAVQSARWLGFWRRTLYRLVAPLAAGLVRLAWRSCRVVAVVGGEQLDAALAHNSSCVPVYWHQHHLFCVAHLLARQRGLPLRTGFLISPSRDGELGAMVIRRLGGYVVRGSSTRTGALAMKELFQALMREGVSPVINPDGPRGPRFKAKPGALMLAQMSGRELLPMAYCASRATLFHWDRFVLPWPGARIAVAIGEPMAIARGGGQAAIELAQRELERRLHATFRAARAALDAHRGGGSASKES